MKISLVILFLLIINAFTAKKTLSEEITPEDFIEFSEDRNLLSAKAHDSPISLVYITPWNRDGYKTVSRFSTKISHVSPVWFELRFDAKKGSSEITGKHNLDLEWINSLNDTNIKILPRLLFDQWEGGDFQMFLYDNTLMDSAINQIIDYYKSNNFHGVVLEVWSQHSGTDQMELIKFIKLLYKKLNESKLLLILVIPPPFYRDNIEGRFQSFHYEKLVKHVDHFSLMTYDYSNVYSPGPNAPLDWIKSCIESLVRQDKPNKILVGLNFYGYEFNKDTMNARHILGREYVEILTKYKKSAKIIWDKTSSEHVTLYQDNKKENLFIFYPTPLSVRKRVSLVLDLACSGIAIWEGGQGLNVLFEQL